MLIAIWNMLQTGETFNDPGGDFYSKRNPDRAKRALDQLRNLGYTVTLESTAA
jgi:transposase